MPRPRVRVDNALLYRSKIFRNYLRILYRLTNEYFKPSSNALYRCGTRRISCKT